MKISTAVTGWMILVLLTTTGCGTRMVEQQVQGPGQNPYYLCANADKLLAQKDVAGARELYERALEIQKNYAPALTGLGNIQAQTGNPKEATNYYQRAMRNAADKPEHLAAATRLLALYYSEQQYGWFQDMTALWKKIANKHETPEQAALIMGKAHLDKEDVLQASVFFRQVVDWDRAQAKHADELLKKLYQQLRAEPGTAAAQEMARQKSISRADLAVLLIEELKITEYINAVSHPVPDKAFKTPEQFEKEAAAQPYPADIQGHPYEKDIQLVLAYGFDGLLPGLEDRFEPDTAVNRADFSLVVQDMLSRIQHDPALKTKLVGNASAFSDVPSDHYAFNAIMVCSSRNFLAADLNGAFRPADPVSGAESLLAVKRLKQEIKGQQIVY